jgi:hypothetical protein
LFKPSLKTEAFNALRTFAIHYKNYDVANFTSKAYIKKYGAIPGMAQSMEWHRENTTRTHALLQDKLGKLQIKSLGLESKIIYLPNNMYGVMKNWLQDQTLGNNNRNIVGDVVVHTADFLLAHVFNNTHELHNNADMMNCTPLINYLLPGEYNNSFHNNATLNLHWKLQIPMVEKMILKHIGNLAHGDEAVKVLETIKNRINYVHLTIQNPTRNKNLLINPILVNDVNIFKFMSLYDTVYFWMPMETIHYRGKVMYKHKDSSQIYDVGDEVFNAIEHGDLLYNTYRVHTLNMFGEIRICSISQSRDGWLSTWAENAEFAWLEVPNIILSPAEAIQNHGFISCDKKKININVVSNLRRRLLKIGTTYEDLLVQARTLLNTTQFTSSNVYDKYKLTVEE